MVSLKRFPCFYCYSAGHHKNLYTDLCKPESKLSFPSSNISPCNVLAVLQEILNILLWTFMNLSSLHLQISRATLNDQMFCLLNISSAKFDYELKFFYPVKNCKQSHFCLNFAFLRACSTVVSDLRLEAKSSRVESRCQLCAEVSSLQ